MAPIGKIYGYATHCKVARSVAAAKYNGAELEVVETKPMDGDTQKPEFKSKFPMAKIPAFEGTDGFKLYEGTAIARYVAGLSDNAKLLGTDAKSAALVEQFISLADGEVFDKAVQVMFMCLGFVPYNKQAEAKAWEGVHRALAVFESHLNSNTFLVGHRITLADLTLASNIFVLYTRLAGKEVQDKYPNVMRHFKTVINQPQVSGIWGEPTLATENMKFTPPKKEAAPKAAAKEQPKKAAPKAKEAEDDDDDTPAPPPKPKNPLDELPKSSFNLEEFKRVYSNKDTPEALEWFHQNYDPEGFSVWRIDYKYNDELTQVFMSSNLISGLFTRFEASRKYVMGTAGVFGEANNSAIAGVIVLRGKDWKPVLSVAPDMDSYNVSPLDISSAEGKKTFEDFLKWEAEVDGKKWADGKILK